MNHKVLVFEDDESLVDLFELIFESFNMDFVTSNRALPVAKVNSIAPDVIIMDYWLAEDNAEGLCKALKSDEHTKHIPILLLTAGNQIEQIAERCGADLYMSKPFGLEELRTAIAELIPNSKRT